MKHRNLLGFLFTTIAAMGLFSAGVSADTGDSYYLTLSEQGTIQLYQAEVTPTDQNSNGVIDYDDIFYAAHEQYYTGGAAAGYTAADTQWGLAISKLWGNDSGSYGYYNGKTMPMALTDEVAADSYINAWVYTDTSGWSDIYTVFDKDNYSVKATATQIVTLEQMSYDASFNPVFSSLAGAKIIALGSDNKELAADAYTVKDLKDGSYCVSFDNPGTYKLVATVEGSTVAYVPAVATIDVEAVVLPFKDVSDNDWFKPYVEFVYANDIMKGVESDVFGPDTALTRGMFVTMLYRLAGEPEVADSCIFDDVKAGVYYEKAVVWAFANGVTSGTSVTTFDPEKDITREQLVTLVQRYADKVVGMDVSQKADLSTFKDAGTISSYAVDSFGWTVNAGIINGDGGNLNPGDYATRAQAGKIFACFMSLTR